MTTESQTPQLSDVEMSASIAKFSPAFVKVQAKIKPALKDAKNPHFGSTYADLASAFAACREALSDNGIAVLQAPGADGRKVRVCTMLLHESGEWMRATLTLTAVKEDPQAVGSAITYARRYGLMSMVGLAAEDDDGNAASSPPPQRQGRRDSKPDNFREHYEQRPMGPPRGPAEDATPFEIATGQIRKATNEARVTELLRRAKASTDGEIRERLGELEGLAGERIAALSAMTGGAR